MTLKPNNDELNRLWNDYVLNPSFEKRLLAQHFIATEVPGWLVDKEQRREFMASHTYKTARPILKPLFIDAEFQKLCTAYRAYQYKKLNNLATINIDQTALRQLNRVIDNLGLTANDSGFSDAIDWLTSPGVREEDETKQALFDANNDNSVEVFGDYPSESFLRQVHLLRERMCYNDKLLLARIIEQSFINGWQAKQGTRSNAESRIREKLDDDALKLTGQGIPI